MGDESRKRIVNKKMLFAALGVVLALAAAGAAWAVLGADETADVETVDESTSTVDATDSVNAPSGDATQTATETTVTLSSEPEGGDLEFTYDPNADPAFVDQTTGAVVGVSRSGGAYVLSIDLVDFLAGEEAVAAAKAHGDTVSASGLYIVNDNPKVREYPIQAGLTIRVTTEPDGTPNQLGRAISVEEWAAGVNGPAKAAYTSGTYIMTITNGTVTALEQLYLP